jgi:predicted ATPase
LRLENYSRSSGESSHIFRWIYSSAQIVFQQLHETLAEVVHGQGRVALVSGEAGIGKTSLVEQFAEIEKNRCRVLWGGCDALFTPRPLGPLHDIALQIRGDLLTLLAEEASRATIFSAVFEELRTQPQPFSFSKTFTGPTKLHSIY